MRTNVRRLLLPAAVALAAVGLAATTASAVIDPAPIGPNQFFVGDVNGVTANAVITTDCIGPVRPGQTGHPTGNQFVAVLPGPGSTGPATQGFTGSAGNSVRAVLSPPISSSNAPILLGTIKDYVVHLAIPTDITVPCNGPADVTFVPLPTSGTAKNAVVHVTLASIGV